MLWLEVIALFVAGAATVAMGLLVLSRRAKNLVNITFFILAASMGCWALCIAFFLLTEDPDVAFAWAKAYYFFPLITVWAAVLFVKLFPDEQKISKKWLAFATLAFLALTVPLLMDPTFVTERLAYHDWGKEIILDKVDYTFYTIYLAVLLPLALWTLYQISKHANRFYAAQARLFFLGFSTVASFGVFFNLVLPWFGNYQLIWLGPLFTSSFVVTVAYSIVRHRMFDIRLVAARAFAYVLSFLTILIGYAILLFGVLQIFFRESVDASFTHNAVYLFLALLLAVTYNPIKRFFDDFTDRIFFHHQYNLEKALSSIGDVAVEAIDLNKLMTDAQRILYAAFRPSYILFVILPFKHGGEFKYFNSGEITPTKTEIKDFLEASRWHLHGKKNIFHRHDEQSMSSVRKVMDRHDADIILRMKTTRELNGYILVGPKQNGGLYTKKDLQLLSTAADELALAIQNALRFEEIRAFNRTLQGKVDDATAKLRRTNARLRELDDAKDEFVSMASHQLRTPLTSVKGYLSMALEGDAGELKKEQKKLLEEAYNGAQRMVYLIGDFLNVSRIKTGKFMLEFTRANLAQVIGEEVGQLRATAEGRNLNFVYEAPEVFPEARLDENKIRQVAMNLIDNAIFYTKPGGTVKVQLYTKDGQIIFRVQDDGIGVPAREQKDLFEKFYRASNARKIRPDGTGLGLFMIKKVVLAHGGAIIFESHEGKGSTFGFMLPLKHSHRAGS